MQEFSVCPRHSRQTAGNDGLRRPTFPVNIAVESSPACITAIIVEKKLDPRYRDLDDKDCQAQQQLATVPGHWTL